MKKLILDQMKSSQERLDRSWAKEKAPLLISCANLHADDYAVDLTAITNRQLVLLNEELGLRGWHLACLQKDGCHRIEELCGKNGLPPGAWLLERATGKLWKVLARGSDQDGVFLLYSLQDDDGAVAGIDELAIGPRFVIAD